MSSSRDPRGELAAHHAAGGVLTASSWTPDDSGLRQTVAIHRTPKGAVRVHVETYQPTEWDTEVEVLEQRFDDLEAALGWLESERGIRSSQLDRQPQAPS